MRTYPDWWESSEVGHILYGEDYALEDVVCKLCDATFDKEGTGSEIWFQYEWEHYRDNHPDFMVMIRLSI